MQLTLGQLCSQLGSHSRRGVLFKKIQAFENVQVLLMALQLSPALSRSGQDAAACSGAEPSDRRTRRARYPAVPRLRPAGHVKAATKLARYEAGHTPCLHRGCRFGLVISHGYERAMLGHLPMKQNSVSPINTHMALTILRNQSNILINTHAISRGGLWSERSRFPSLVSLQVATALGPRPLYVTKSNTAGPERRG